MTNEHWGQDVENSMKWSSLTEETHMEWKLIKQEKET